jgi:hypothetical protein
LTLLPVLERTPFAIIKIVLPLFGGLRQIELSPRCVESANGGDEIILGLRELRGIDRQQRRTVCYRVAGFSIELDNTAGIGREHGCRRVVIVSDFALGRVLGPEA